MASKLTYYYEMGRQLRSLRSIHKLWNYTKYRFLKRRATTSIQRYTPQIASLLVTLRCNLNCDYCNTAKILQEKKGNWKDSEANLEKIKRIFANPLFANCLFVDLMGGEPLLVEDLGLIIAHLRAEGRIVNLSTNGLLLAGRISELKRAGISRINLSLYEANRSVVEKDLSKINEIFPVHASMVLLRSMTETGKNKILETARFLKNSGCLSLRFWMYRPIGLRPRLDEVTVDTDTSYIEFRQQMERELSGFCLWPSMVQSGIKIKKLCPQLWQRVGCDMFGNMAICCGTDTLLSGPSSNLFEAPPDAVFNHPTLVTMREQLLDPDVEPPAICKNCNLLSEPGW